MKSQRNLGFTLIELSISLIVIGLVIGGILGGKSLLHQAKLLKVATEAKQFHVAIISFQQQFNALPGDLSTASSDWPGETNGNQNKKIEYKEGEGPRFWRHLQLAGLIPGKFTGLIADLDHGTDPGVNGPVSAYDKKAGWFAASSGYSHASATMWTLITNMPAGQTYLGIGKDWYNNPEVGVLFSPLDASNLDKKIDDGVANTGSIAANGGQINPPSEGPSGVDNFSTLCVNAGTYLIANAGQQCFMAFIIPK